MIYRPDDEEDPTANDCNYNFPQILFAFLLGAIMMFLLSLDDIQKFKGCNYESRTYRTRTNGGRNVSSNEVEGTNRSMGVQEEL